MVEDEVRYLGKSARAAEAYEREKPAHTLRTFAQVEALWEVQCAPT